MSNANILNVCYAPIVPDFFVIWLLDFNLDYLRGDVKIFTFTFTILKKYCEVGQKVFLSPVPHL